jgi:hypothetical protein
MARSDPVFIKGVADHAFVIDFRSVIRISGREARLGMPNYKHDGDRDRAGCSIWSANARAQALDTTDFLVHDMPPCHGSSGIAGRSKNSRFQITQTHDRTRSRFIPKSVQPLATPPEQKLPGFGKTRSVGRLILHRAAGPPKLGLPGTDIKAIRKACTPGGAWSPGRNARI